jgi:CheY-like chemotaxis protein
MLALAENERKLLDRCLAFLEAQEVTTVSQKMRCRHAPVKLSGVAVITIQTVDRPLRIFVVDDERVIAHTLAQILLKNGFCATWFTDANEALLMAVQSTPDLVVSDVAMPVTSGIDLAIALRIQCPSCKILLLSGQAETEDLLVHARRGGYDFRLLAKPIWPSELLDEIRWMLASESH